VFLHRLDELAQRLLNERVVDRLFVVLQTHEDRAITTRYVSQCGDPRLTPIIDDLAPEELMGMYRGAEFLIGRRLHAGVFALLMGVPVVLFSRDGQKVHGVMHELGMEDSVIPYPDFSVEEVFGRLIAIAGYREEERKAVRDMVEETQARAAAGLSAVAELLRAGESAAERVAEPSA
jgi:polysaccharide pyruvyl transferase WcaK-like protein